MPLSLRTKRPWRIGLSSQSDGGVVVLEPWPRLLHAMRASRETELAAEYPLHVVTAWLGNTPKIALQYYLQPGELRWLVFPGCSTRQMHLAGRRVTEKNRKTRVRFATGFRRLRLPTTVARMERPFGRHMNWGYDHDRW